MRLVLRVLQTLTVGLALGACGGGGDGDPFTPTEETVAGNYTAFSFTLTSSLGTVDLLALGSTVNVVLAANGTTTGRLFVPGGEEGGGDLDVDLAGTWALAGTTVTFNQTADTFIRDVEFTVAPNQLSAEGTFNGDVVQLVLRKPG